MECNSRVCNVGKKKKVMDPGEYAAAAAAAIK